MAATEVSRIVLNQSPKGEKEKMLAYEDHEEKRITTKDVYDLGKRIAQEMQRLTADYGKGCLEGLVDKVVRALEWLELCAVQNEELQKTKCQLLLKEDELAREKEKVKKLQMDLKGITLVVEERGRQRDIFAGKLSDLEIQNANCQEMLNAYEQANTYKQRSKRYSTIIDENEPQMSLVSRTKSLDRREMKPLRLNKAREKDMLIEQLQKELTQEKRKVTDFRESSTMDQRRIQQRVKHMEQEMSSLNKQLSIAQIQIERLKQEKTALLQRSEVISEVRAIQLATVARQNSNSEDGGSSPKFYKRDLVMILKERNELKEKINGLEEELASAQKRIKNSSKSNKINKDHSPRSKRGSSYCSAPCIQEVWERTEGSMVILDVPNYYIHQGGKSNSMKAIRTSSNSGSDHSLLTNSCVSNDSNRPNGGLYSTPGSQGDIDDDSTSL